MILLIYPFGKRIRKVAPKAHTIAEVMFARHGRSSQLMLAGSNVLGSLISLTSNLIAGGALISMLSPFTLHPGHRRDRARACSPTRSGRASAHRC